MLQYYHAWRLNAADWDFRVLSEAKDDLAHRTVKNS